MNVSPKKLSQFSKKEIDIAFTTGTRVVKNTAMTILRAPRQLLFGRILIITPKAVGSAPVRNKIRRQIKAIFYENRLYDLPYDWIVINKRTNKPLTFDELKQLLLDTCKKS